MDIKNLTGKLKTIISKYKYAAIVLVIGAALLLIPEKKQQTKSPVTENTVNSQTLEIESLSNILQAIDGAGNVQVLLSIANGEETTYQTNCDTSNASGDNRAKIETVIITDSQRNETGLITQVNPPTYLGAIVVCQGADSATVRLAITQAVAKITGLGTDDICVLKMK